MRRFAFIGIWLLILPAVVLAETMYVSELMEITLRTGQGVDHKIIAMLKSGEKLEVLEPSDPWTKIRTINGTEGWVLSRFLQSEQPNSITLKQLKEKHNALMAQVAPFFEENESLKKENESLHSELIRSENALNESKKSYKTLKEESAKFLQLQSNYDKAKNLLKEEKIKTAKYEDELSKLEGRQTFLWFFSGASVFFLGFLIGFSAKRQRRRPSLL